MRVSAVLLLLGVVVVVWAANVTDPHQSASVGAVLMSLGGLAFWVWLITLIWRAGRRYVLGSRLKPDVLAAKLDSARDALMRALVERGVVPEIRQILPRAWPWSDSGTDLAPLSW